MSFVPVSTAKIAEAENIFYLQGQTSRLGKLLAHYELYRRIMNMPGAVVELGVYKGASLMRFAAFRELLENQDSREIHGFDAFGAFPRQGVADASDQAFIERFEGERGQGVSCTDMKALLAAKNMRNVHLHEGNIFDTVPALLEERPEFRIALLHLDVDVYEPTAFALERLLPYMVPGGLILFDDYGMVAGATRAGDELAARFGLQFEKLPYYAIPAFLKVPGRLYD